MELTKEEYAEIYKQIEDSAPHGNHTIHTLKTITGEINRADVVIEWEAEVYYQYYYNKDYDEAELDYTINEVELTWCDEEENEYNETIYEH